MGLSPEFINEARKILLEAFPIYASIPLTDLREVWRSNESGGVLATQEPHRGISAFVAFDKMMTEAGTYDRFEAAIQAHQPELSGFLTLPGHGGAIQVHALLGTWCNHLVGKDDVSGAIDQLLADVGALLDGKKLIFRAVTALVGLDLESPQRGIDFGNGAKIRALSADELSQLSSADRFSPGPFHWHTGTLSTCVVYEEECSFSGIGISIGAGRLSVEYRARSPTA